MQRHFKFPKQRLSIIKSKRIAYLFIGAGFAVIAIGLYLRIQNSNARIFHSDEAVQAYQLWELMDKGHYEYDPIDKHGPLLYYLSYVLNKSLGIDASELTQNKTRLLPIAASATLLFLMVFGRRRIDPTALLAGAFFAVSPLPVIYGAYYVQEALFVLLGFVTLYTFNEFWRTPTLLKAARCGLWAAALFATKETAIIHVAALIGATLLAQEEPIADLKGLFSKRMLQCVAVGLLAFAAMWVVFFTAAFTEFHQLKDSLTAFINYAERSQGQGHEKPFYYYIALFWPRVSEGVHWGETLFLLLATSGFVLLLRDRKAETRHLRLSVFYGFGCLFLYLIIPYKTPWLMLTSCVSLSFAAAHALLSLSRYKPWWSFRIAASSLAIIALLDQYHSSVYANRYAADSRNPYLYQHTSPQFKKLIERLNDLDGLNPNVSLAIAVGGADNAWPLPWFLRDNPTVGYWQNPQDVPPLDVIIVPQGSLPSTLHEGYVVEYHGLRENVVLECWIRQDLWDAFMRTRT